MLPLQAAGVTLASLACLSATPAPDGWLGVYLAQDRGEAVVAEVIPDSPAAKAGLQVGDVLLAVGDRATADAEQFIAAIRGAATGERVRLKIRRGEAEKVVTVRLGERPTGLAAKPAGSAPAAPAAPAGETPAVVEPGYLGIRAAVREGRVVVEQVFPGTPAARAGLAERDLILAVAGHEVRSLADLEQALGTCSAGQRVELAMRRANEQRSVLVELGRRDGAVAAAPAATPTRPAAADATAPARDPVLREIEALRNEVRELRQLLEQLRAERGRE